MDTTKLLRLRLVGGDVAEDAAHDLAAPRLRQRGHHHDNVRSREGTDSLPNLKLQLARELR